jgi:hypothetical protein
VRQSFFLLAALVASILLNANSAMAQSISFTRLSGSGDVAISPSQDGIVSDNFSSYGLVDSGIRAWCATSRWYGIVPSSS